MSTGSQPEGCISFLAGVSKIPNGSEVGFDIEKAYRIEDGMFVQAYDAMRPINSGCTLGSIIPISPSEIKSPWKAHEFIDVASGTHNGSPWIQFVYPSIDDGHGSGLSSSIVFYDDEGHPISTSLVSSYHSWEGARVLNSKIKGSQLERCTQFIEFFSYTKSGDIDQELDTPIRSSCAISHGELP
ncbi:hypothetical protein ACW7G5_09560 [Luteimonas sp. A501]